MQKLKELLYQYRHGILILYTVPYMLWFSWLQANVQPRYWVGSWIDAHIPFQELFVIPYLLWFAYIVVTLGWFFFTSRPDFLKACALLFSGMTICLILYTLFPNGQILRPLVFPRDNIFTDLVRGIYLVDPPTNVCPSIHCFNSMAVHIALRRSKLGKNHKWVRCSSGILMVLICMSTVFIKQHSIEDFFASLLLLIPLYLLVYRREELRALFLSRAGTRSRHPKYGQ